MERLCIVLPSILLISFYFTEVFSVQSVSQLKTPDKNACSVAKQFPCPLCDQRFSQKGAVKRHVRGVHERQRPFECPQCGQRFSKRGDVTKHVSEVHEGKRPFECPQCTRIFKRRAHLTKHVRGVHEGKRPFECPQCKKRFLRKESLTRHQKSCCSGTADRISPPYLPEEPDLSSLVSSSTLLDLHQDLSLPFPASEIEADSDGDVSQPQLPKDFMWWVK